VVTLEYQLPSAPLRRLLYFLITPLKAWFGYRVLCAALQFCGKKAP